MMTNFRLVQADTVEGPYLSVTPPMYVAKALNESFVINVEISNVQNLRAFEFKLGYNTTILDVLKVLQGYFFPPSPRSFVEKLEINETVGFVWMRVSLSDSEPAISGSGTLARIAFNVSFNSTSNEENCCALNLYDSLLYDNSMATIVHSSVCGLYFFGRVQDDPPSEGRLLDLYTQNGGETQGASGGNFKFGDMVELNANLTYNLGPVEGKLVSIEVLGPKNESVTGRVQKTNSGGFVTVNFTIPSISESAGTWTVIAIVDVAGKSVWDFLTFNVMPPIPVGGYSIPIENSTITKPLVPYSTAIVILAVAFTIARRKHHQ
jgi:hypothetical protein